MVHLKLGKEGYKTVSTVRGFEVIIDEPESIGGSNLGPSPTEMLLASLAGCMAITMRLYANRKGWDTGEIDVEVSFGENKTIRKKITFEKELEEEQRKRIIEIGGRCPVSKYIQNPTEIHTIA